MDRQNTYKFDSEDFDEDEADQGAPINYDDYINESMGAGETDQPLPTSSIQPEVASQDHAAIAMSRAQNLSNLQSWGRSAVGLYPRPPLSVSSNPVVNGMLDGNQMVNMPGFHNLTTDVDHLTGIDPRLLDTSSNHHLNLGPIDPGQSVSQTDPVGHELTARQTGPDSPALPLGMATQYERLPPAEQDAAGPSPPLLTHAFSMPVDASHDHALCEGELAPQPAVEAQPSEAQQPEANTNQETPFQCGICGQVCRDLLSLKEHCGTHLPAKKAGRYGCIVDNCVRTSAGPKDWKRHLFTHFKHLIVPEFCDEPGCPEAGTKYKRHDHLLRHKQNRHPESDAAKDCEMTKAQRLANLQQPPGFMGETSKKPAKNQSKVGAAKRSSKSKSTRSSLSRQPSAEPAMQYQQSLPSYEGSRMFDSMPASTSNGTSVFTPAAAESLFASAGSPMQNQWSLPTAEVSQTVDRMPPSTSDSASVLTPDAGGSMFTFSDAEYSPSPSPGPQSFSSAPWW